MADVNIMHEIIPLIEGGDFTEAIERFKRSPVIESMGIHNHSDAVYGRILEGRLLYISMQGKIAEDRCCIAAYILKNWLNQLENEPVANVNGKRMQTIETSINLSAGYMVRVLCVPCKDPCKKPDKVDTVTPLKSECRCRRVVPIWERIRAWQSELDKKK